MHQVVEKDAHRLPSRLNQERGDLQLAQRQRKDQKPREAERGAKNAAQPEQYPRERPEPQQLHEVRVLPPGKMLNETRDLPRNVEEAHTVCNGENRQAVVKQLHQTRPAEHS